jgi:hypothetical protein
MTDDVEIDMEIVGEETPEELDDEDVIYQINTFGADFDVDGLVKRFDRGDIFTPKFQRNFVWTWPQASKFIESILLGLPIPSVFLYREEATQKLLIVDGLQRLTTLHSFKKGRFQHNDRIFRLKDVKSRYEGKTLEELAEEDQRRFEDAIIHAMVIQQMSPDGENSSVFHIFDRLNSNGTPLQPQEMRAAVYHGSFQELLGTLNENSNWREIFGPVHRRAKDQELILRFLALKHDRDNYQRPMKGFLNTYMNKVRNVAGADAQSLEKCFLSTISRAHEALGKQAFRPARSMNVAFFDALMVAISEAPGATEAEIKAASVELIKNEDFMTLTSEATSNEPNVLGRIQLAKDVLNATAQGN